VSCDSEVLGSARGSGPVTPMFDNGRGGRPDAEAAAIDGNLQVQEGS